MAVLQFDFTTDSSTGSRRTNTGLQLIDTVSGGIAKAYTDYAGWFVEYTDSGGSHTNTYLGDYGAYEDPIPQTITLTLDYDNDTMDLSVSAPYKGDTLVSEGTTGFAIGDASFVPNQILHFSHFVEANAEIDDISYTPEPGSLVLLGLGTLLLMFSRRRR